MKALKLKALAFAFLITMGAITWGRTVALEPSPNSRRFLKEHQDIQTDLSKITLHRNEIASLKAELKADRKAKLKMDVIVDKKEITKAKADLSAAKKYLRADKTDLRRDYRLVIREERKEVMENRAALADAKRQLRRDMRNNNGVVINSDAARVSRLMAKHEASQMALIELKIDRNNDMIAVNEDIRAANAGFAGTTYIEDGQAHASNWMLK